MKPMNLLVYWIFCIVFFSVTLSNAKRSLESANRATHSFLATVVGRVS